MLRFLVGGKLGGIVNKRRKEISERVGLTDSDSGDAQRWKFVQLVLLLGNCYC